MLNKKLIKTIKTFKSTPKTKARFETTSVSDTKQSKKKEEFENRCFGIITKNKISQFISSQRF